MLRYGNSLGGCGSNTQPSNGEADTLPLSYCLLYESHLFAKARSKATQLLITKIW